jgi:predicted alpha/beta superfamily hydrolase
MSWSKGVPAQASGGPVNIWTYTWPDELGEIADETDAGRGQGRDRRRLQAGRRRHGRHLPLLRRALRQADDREGLRIAAAEEQRVRCASTCRPATRRTPAKRYPVLYMHDGQNLFDAKTAAYGVEWGIDETINRLVATGVMDEVIVVGIDNTPDRIPEYTPCCDPKYGGGKLDAYGAFVVDTVKPYVDRSYRTLPGKDNTAIMGSSLGGIASVAIAQRYPDTFSKAGGVSSSFWWNKGALIEQAARKRLPVQVLPRRRHHRRRPRRHHQDARRDAGQGLQGERGPDVLQGRRRAPQRGLVGGAGGEAADVVLPVGEHETINRRIGLKTVVPAQAGTQVRRVPLTLDYSGDSCKLGFPPSRE